MKKEFIATGKTIEEAVASACTALGCLEAEAVVEVLEAPSKKLLGIIGGNDAKVKVTYEADEAENEIHENENKGEALGTAPEKYLTEVIGLMGVGKFTVTAKEDEESLFIFVEGEDLGAVIGRRGETLDALQHLANLVNRRDGNGKRVVLDCGEYRKKREAFLQRTAKSAISRAIRNNRSIALEPMNAYERRYIHTIVQEAEGAKSWSVGEEPYRKVIIASETAPAYNENKSRRDRRSGGNHNDRLVYEHEKGAPIGTRSARVPHPKRDISSGIPANDELGSRANDGEFFSLYEKIEPTKKMEE